MENIITVGSRATVISDRWEEFKGQDVLISKRNGNKFNVIVLASGVKEITLEPSLFEDEAAWFSLDELEFVDNNLEANMAGINWYQEHQDEYCPDCGAYITPPNDTCDTCGILIWI